MKQSDLLGSLLFVMPHYQTFLESIEWAPNCVFPSLANDTHIVDPMNEIILAFNHLLTQLTLVGLKVKMLKCKLWSPLRIYSSIKILWGTLWSQMAYAFWVH